MIQHGMIALLLTLVTTHSAFTEDEGTALDFKMKTIEGKQISLKKKYLGKVVLFVNVASQCGYTSQYAELQKLHEKYASKGLAIVGVPCNQFGAQEPGSDKEILSFCQDNYQVTFDMLAKVNVKGSDACGLYKHLSKAKPKPNGKGDVGWNFEKFVVNRKGQAVARFNSGVEPDADKLIKVIEAELSQKK